ncbi:hypothetical protein C1645_838368 [Glomus cerebriforme]|uniref:Uncharacterized protein n=1 Tax=Glomus cerebriforme TaxID=658196 RepID=A0A397S9E9_9GLOM|nr:hypothetical protein C1645_838368 [Glomus cerebriforme]
MFSKILQYLNVQNISGLEDGDDDGLEDGNDDRLEEDNDDGLEDDILEEDNDDGLEEKNTLDSRSKNKLKNNKLIKFEEILSGKKQASLYSAKVVYNKGPYKAKQIRIWAKSWVKNVFYQNLYKDVTKKLNQ